MFVKEDVNRINSPTWVRMNEDARKLIHRRNFIETFGGRFIEKGSVLKWQEVEDVSDKYVIQTPDNRKEIVEVFSKYCRENDLNKAAMYGTLRGERKQHKGYRLLKRPD
jgi:hypothetical protein